MKSKAVWFSLLAAGVLIVPIPRVRAQQSQETSGTQTPGHGAMGGMDMGGAQTEGGATGAAAQSANESMSRMHMDMGAHMTMTALRPEVPADDQRAAAIVATLRSAIEKYRDYHVALADGYKIFLPNIPQQHYHFTSSYYGLEAQFTFDPTHPTSLLYTKTNDGWQLEGAMYTAPRRFTEDQLNARVPLSVARWHQHTNLCLPPRGARFQDVDWKEFGLRGSIATEDACEQAGGRWHAVVFNWMVHVYPFETDPKMIWAH
ncbi:MAG: hypothetical protein ACRD5R_08975 [Candidatus Acidiferrales bacterium]